VSSTIFAKAIAVEVFKVDSPAVFVRRVSCEIMLGSWWPFADSTNVVSDLNGQIAYMVRIPRSILACDRAPGRSGQFTAKQKAETQQ
jgi:hypothetical protein